jgi:hypothetical protein
VRQVHQLRAGVAMHWPAGNDRPKIPNLACWKKSRDYRSETRQNTKFILGGSQRWPAKRGVRKRMFFDQAVVSCVLIHLGQVSETGCVSRTPGVIPDTIACSSVQSCSSFFCYRNHVCHMQVSKVLNVLLT